MTTVPFLACLAGLSCLLHQAVSMRESLVVSVTGGLVQGTRYKGSVRFLGLPYATAQRFQFPSPVVPAWTGLLNASQPGPQCLQKCPPVIRDLYCLPENRMSEVCLSLNVYRPAYNLPAGNTFPVMVFIHDGDFESGSGAAPLYDGEFLAKQGGVIIVTINYRLGALGFLPIFNRYDDVIGNFGIRDQEMALRWVQKNIAAFDGDPSKVTLFGAGAGCQSVALHLTSVTAQNLFRSAILQSCPFTLPFRNKNEARRVVKRFASALGCQDNDLDCYRQKSATEILRAQDDAADTASTEPPSLFQFQAWGPIIDQRGVHDSHLLQELLQANSRPVSGTPKPIMMGFAEEEGRTSVYRDFPLPVSSDFFQQFVQTVFPDKWRQVAETAEAPYRPSTNQDARLEMVRFLNDFVYVCPGHRVAQQLSGSAGASGNNRDVWVYSFKPSVTWSPGGSAWPLGGESYCQDVACHDLDLLYLFNPPSIPDFRRLRTEGLSTAMATYWTNFAKYGDPNGVSPPPRSVPTTHGGFGQTRHQPHQLLSSSLFSRPAPAPSSLIRLVQVAGSSRQAAPSPPGRQSVAPIGSGRLTLRQPSFPGSGFLVLVSSLFQRPTVVTVTQPSTSSAPPSVFWPSYVTGDNSNQALVLTQPLPVAQQSVFGQRCEFWEAFGYS